MVDVDIVVKNDRVHIYLEDGMEIEVEGGISFPYNLLYYNIRVNRHRQAMGNIPASEWLDITTPWRSYG